MSNAASPSPKNSPAHPAIVALAPFFATNSGTESRTLDADTALITKPWGEVGFGLRVRSADEATIAALNGLLLPEMFTAVWHLQSKDLEIIWAPIDTGMDEAARSFDFHFEGRIYRCEYAPTSAEVIAIANATVLIASRPISESSRFHNLSAIRGFENVPKLAEPPSFRSTSFWIRDVDWDSESLVRLARNLNFHMYYFDRHTPQVVIHEGAASILAQQPLRYPFGSFPPTIIGKPIEPFLLGLWAGSIEGDIRLRFLYLYQILEYAAFYWMRDTTQQAVRRVLSSPESYMQPNIAMRQIMDVLASERSSDEQKLSLAVRQLVDPEPLWAEVAANLKFFTAEIRFDGGVTIGAPISSSCTVADFCSDWKNGHKLIGALKDIRNALVHGREARMSNVIEPTVANDIKLRQFLPPLTCIAMRVALAMDS